MASTVYYFLFIYQCFTAQMLKVCRTPGPTTCLRCYIRWCLKRLLKEKKSMTELGSLEPAVI